MPAKYHASDEDMDASYAGATAAKDPQTSQDAPKGDEQSVDQENAMGDTAVISNKILSPDGDPIKEGDEIVVKIVKNYGDESEIMYAPKKEGGHEDGMTSEKMDEQTGSEIAAMDQKG